jgi:hypothetical protein
MCHADAAESFTYKGGGIRIRDVREVRISLPGSCSYPRYLYPERLDPNPTQTGGGFVVHAKGYEPVHR